MDVVARYFGHHGGKLVKLSNEVFNGRYFNNFEGDRSLYKSGVSLKTIMKEVQQQGQGVIVELSCLHAEISETTHYSTTSLLVEELMRKHPRVFEAARMKTTPSV